ncbi:MAG: Fe-S cluster assembly protein SufD [Gammaproteobacteria bacterium]
MNTAVEHYAREFARVGPDLPGAKIPIIANYRRRAMARFHQTGFPTTRLENWKYTDVAPIARRPFRLATVEDRPLEENALRDLRFVDLSCHELVFVNGHFAPHLSNPDGLPDGASARNLAQVLAGEPELFHDYVRYRPTAEEPGFDALNSAFVSDGLLLTLAPGTMLEKPIHLLFVSRPSETAIVSHPRVIIEAAEGCRVRVLESYRNVSECANFTNAVTEIRAGAGSVLEHYKILDEGAGAYHIGRLSISQCTASQVMSHAIAFGAALSRSDIHVTLDGEGAQVTLNGLYLVEGREHVDFHTRIDHTQPSTRSRETYKGVLNGSGRGIFNGKVVVHKGAQKADAALSNKNLLLSKHAEANTKPELEIYADDVACSHAATVSQLDENQLFYLRSRGIDRQVGLALLTYAFADDVIARIQIEPVRHALEQTLLGHLPDSKRIRELVKWR